MRSSLLSTSRRHFVSLMLALAFGASAVSGGYAVQPSSDAATYEVDRRGEEIPGQLRPGAPLLTSLLSRSPEWSRFVAGHPGWTARWDMTSRIPERLQGPPRPVPGFAAVDATNAEAAARTFLRDDAMPWVPADELIWVRTAADRGGLWVHFQQTHEGVLVWNSRVSVRLTRQGKVAMVTNRTYPQVPSPGASRISPQAAMEAARGELPGSPTPVGDPVMTFLPIRRSDHYEQRLTWRYEFRTQDPPGAWTSFVDAADGSLLWRFNTIQYAEVYGQVTGAVEPFTPDTDVQERPFPHVAVSCVSETDTVETLTDADGNYSVATSSAGGRTVEARLFGPYGMVIDANSGRIPRVAGAVPDGDSARIDLQLVDPGASIVERDAYYSAMTAHAYLKTIEPTATFMDYTMSIVVNIDLTCNAFWDGYGINFYAAGDGCVNTARVADVVYHEYGHGITDRLYRPFYPSGAMAEGFSDYFAATIMRQPLIGIGFRGPGTFLRRIDVDRVYPQDWVGQVHTDGLIIASALWDLREILGVSQTDSLFHFARYGLADNFDDYFFDLLQADDDNGDVYDGTPNLDLIARVFRAHGIGDYGIHVSHVPRSDTEDTTMPVPLTASFLSVYAIEPELVQAHVAIIRGGETTRVDVAMTPTGNTREFTVGLDAQPAGTRIEYYFTAGDTAGTTVTWPENGEADPFVFQVGADTTPPEVVHEALPDQPLDIAAIRVRAKVTDNLDQPLRSVNLVQMRNDGPSATSSMTSTAGTADYIAGVSTEGLVLGDSVKYRIQAEDGAIVANITTEPAEGWHSFRVVRGFERDLEANDGGFQGTNDWEWGYSSIVGAVSGQNVWGTILNDTYHDTTSSILACAPIDLSGFTSAALLFHHFLACEQKYDGGFVEVSIDGGSTWDLVRPDGDYNDRIAAAYGTPGYSGRTQGWVPARFDLYRYLGQADVRIRFTFAADMGNVGPGWYLDDISVVERQILERPMNLQARSGGDRRVPLQWEPPAGVVESGPNPVIGYNVYRSGGKEDQPSLLNTEPLDTRQYNDTTAVNGEPYLYYTSALYVGGPEGPLSEPVSAMAYQATLSAELASITAAIDSSGVVDTTIVIRNAGTGFLEVNAYLADSSQTIDDVRITIPMQDNGRAAWGRAPGMVAPRWLSPGRPAIFDSAMPAAGLYKKSGGSVRTPVPGVDPRDGLFQSLAWDTVATDQDDPPGIEPDLAAMQALQTDTSFSLRVTAHESMAALSETASMVILLDTDQNIETGLRGGEFIVVAGMIALERFGVQVVLLDRSQHETDGLNYGYIFGNRVEFGLDKDALGRPVGINVSVAVRGLDSNLPLDSMPDGPSTLWLARTPLHLSITSGSEDGLTLALSSEALPTGLYKAKVILESNDQARPVVEIPVTFLVQTMTPVLLSGLAAEARDEGVVLSWQAPTGLGYAGFDVYRRMVWPDAGEELRITGEPLAPAWNGEYRFVDTGALAGRQYEYRVAGLALNGDREYFGPLAVTTRGMELPQVLWLGPCVPNPVRQVTSVRFGIPHREEDVRLALYAPDGRLVRTVVEGGGKDAGYYVATWDGRDDRGQPAAAGVYFVLLETGRQHRTQKVLLLR